MCGFKGFEGVWFFSFFGLKFVFLNFGLGLKWGVVWKIGKILDGVGYFL